MKKRRNTKDIVLIAVLISLSVILSLFDRLISQGLLASIPAFAVMAPNFKIGLANIVILIILYNYGFKFAILSVTLKVLILALFNPNGAPMSFGGSYLSFFIMYILIKLTKNIKYIYFVSSIGGFSHSLGQIIFGFLYYGLIDVKKLFITGEVNSDILIYSPVMLLIGLITGILIGGIAMQVDKYLNNKKEKKVLYIAHRGCKINGGVENTEQAFMGGVKAKAAGLECDVRVTSDGQFIIFHDNTLERLTNENVKEHLYDVNRSTYDSIKDVELTQIYKDTVHHGKICLFKDYLKICRDNNMIPIIELKWTNGIYSDNKDPNNYNFSNIDKLIAMIKEYELFETCYIITSMVGCLQYLREKYPTIKLQVLCQQQVSVTQDICEKYNINVDVDYHYITKELVDDYHKRGLIVNIWTLNDEKEHQKYLDMGVDMITSDWIIKE